MGRFMSSRAPGAVEIGTHPYIHEPATAQDHQEWIEAKDVRVLPSPDRPALNPKAEDGPASVPDTITPGSVNCANANWDESSTTARAMKNALQSPDVAMAEARQARIVIKSSPRQ